MINKIGNGRDLKREKLYKVVPRNVPFSVGISPSDICNFRCSYCNQSTVKGIKDAKILDWDDFLVLAKQLEELVLYGGDVKIKNIRFIGNGEPLLNKLLPDMIAYLKKRNISDRFEVTTNGSMLSYDMSDRLIKAGLTRLLVSIQGTNSLAYKNICKYNIDMNEFINQIAYFYKNKDKCQVFIKTVDIALPDDEDKEKFLEMFSPYCDMINIEKVIKACADVNYDKIISNKMNDTTRYGERIVKKICCDTLFMYMNVHSNGDVDCCGCKYPPHYIGNIYKKSLKEIWNGKTHKELMLKHLSGKRFEVSDCATCESIEHYNGCKEDNLDDHLLEVKRRVECL